MRKKADKNKNLKDFKLENENLSEENLSDSSKEPKEDDRYAYEDGEFDPDKWEDYNLTKKRGFLQNGMGLFVSIIAIILFAALFVVEFRSYTKVKKGDNVYVPENKEDVVKPDDKILEIIETGSNYTIYLDNNTGIEYVLFRVGSSISIQPLINPDGSYKQHVEPTTSAISPTETTTKHKWIDNLKMPGAGKATQAPTKQAQEIQSSIAATVSPQQ